MWNDLPKTSKEEYKKLILAFASLSEMFSQKAETSFEEGNIEKLAPIINSKFQETAFKKAFNASVEDIGNTSFDAALCIKDGLGEVTKYLIGIKTFGVASNSQKIAQFKTNNEEWAEIINAINENVRLLDNKTKQKIDEVNHDLYLSLARKVSEIRNQRIMSSKENVRGFEIDQENDNIETVYHVLMPSKYGDEPRITVGETKYTTINIDEIIIDGCTTKNNPTNFCFRDGQHKYKFTPADCQLYMEFDNSNIGQEDWDVHFVDDACQIFLDISNKINEIKINDNYSDTKDSTSTILFNDIDEERIKESVSWTLLNNKGEVELFSGFNSFYGVGSKLQRIKRKEAITKIEERYKDELNKDDIEIIKRYLEDFLLTNSSKKEDKLKKVSIRNHLCEFVSQLGNKELEKDILKLVYRPMNEMYIPIPNSKQFHELHPNFFSNSIERSKRGQGRGDMEDREFSLTFEPSGDALKAYITQDNGKAIESINKQTELGNWILRGVFQLNEYEPLTRNRLEELGINGIRLYKTESDDNVHLKFIWLDDDNLPNDYFK